MKNLLQQLKVLRTAFEKADNAYEPVVFWNKGITQRGIAKTLSALPFKVPDDVANVYQVVNGLVIDWEVRTPDAPWRTKFGVCNIPRLDFLFRHDQIATSKNGKSGLDFYWPDDSTPEEVAHYKEFFVIDYLKTGEFILIRPGNETTKSQLYYHQSPDTFENLNLDFESYVQELIAAKAEYGWQYKFLDKQQPPILESRVQGKAENTHYYHQLTDRVGLLKANPNIRKLKFEPHPGVRSSSVKRIERALGVGFPEEMLLFYYYVNGFKLSWVWEKGNVKLEGNIDLLPLENVFGGTGGIMSKSWKGVFVKALKWRTENTANPVLRSQTMLNFRIESVEGVSKEVGIQFSADNSGSNPTLFLLTKGEAVPLPVSFTTYINRMLETMALQDWHETLLAPNSGFEDHLFHIFSEI